MKRFQTVALTGLLLAIAGCGPKTQTIYTAPIDTLGKQCVQRCEADAQRAALWEELEYKDCLADEYRDQLRDYRRDVRHARKNGKDLPPPYRSHFFNDAEFSCSRFRGFSSQNLYDRCFQGCGGSIDVKLLEPVKKTAVGTPAPKTQSTLPTVTEDATPL